MAGGRPTEYKEEYISKATEYLNCCQDTVEEYHKTRGEKSDTYDRLVHVRLPSIEGFALFLDVNKTSLYEWEKKYPEFSNALDKIRTTQQQQLMDKGLSGEYSPVIAKLILSANHGMREKQDVTTDGKELPIPIINVLSNYEKEDNTDTSEESS